MRRTAVLTLAAALGAGVLSASAAQAETTVLRSVMFVGNNWDGTATIVDAVTHEPLRTIDTIPDRDARMTEILTHPDELAFYLAINQGVGEGHDQYTDDMFSTRDGRLVAVSRPSFADVVGIDLATDRIVWRFPMEGDRADHMAVSPDGTRLLVSDSTANKVHELDLRTGVKLREFASGDTPPRREAPRPPDAPYWWRGRVPDVTPVWTPDTAVLTGPVDQLELATVPLNPAGQLRIVRFDRATVTGLDLTLDEVALTTLWSAFEDCTFRQRSRRLHREGTEPQGSFGHRPCLYRRCTFIGVRFRILAGFSVGEARFEDCVFERCRFSEHFSFDADYVRCRFVGKMTTAVFYGVSPRSGRRNQYADNDFTETEFSDNVDWRADLPIDDQRWPDGYRPPIRDV